MNLRNIGIVYRKELREALRDRRTLISSLLVPLLLFPLLTAGIGAAISALVGEAEGSPRGHDSRWGRFSGNSGGIARFGQNQSRPHDEKVEG